MFTSAHANRSAQASASAGHYAHRSGEHHRYPHEGAGQREARKRSAGTGKLYAGAAPKRRGEAWCAAH